MWPDDIVTAAQNLVTEYTARGKMIATAESCTGGMIIGALTEISGSSSVVDRGFITYSNAAKTAQLGVREADIERHGAVSDVVAAAMASGALDRSDADIAVAVTGVAGPTGGTPDKPVGTVWFGRAMRGRVHTERQTFVGLDRASVRLETVRHALRMLDT
ncbi:MAG: CinA family protein [Pseudomonadota bacterium]